jgi:hypothetical protein
MFHADVGIMYSILEGVEFYSGTERQNMIRHKNDGSMGSMNYGYTWKGYLKRDKEGNMVYRTPAPYPGLYKTKVMDDNPELELVFKEFQELYFPEFNYTSVQMNKNFPIGRHIDGTNVGTSILLCIGDYTGGEVVVEGFNADGSDAIVDNRNSLFQFNGAEYYHWVKPFQGTRYSLVFFSNKTIAKKMYGVE